MTSLLRRSLTVTALLALTIPTAAHAETGDHVVRAETRAVDLSVFEAQVGSSALEAAGTSASVSSDPLAAADVTGLAVLGEAVGELASASTDGERVSDPEEGDGCQATTGAPGLELTAACATATASAAGTAVERDARADAQLAGLDVDGTLVAGALTEPLDALLEDLADDIGDGALNDAVAQLTTACDEILAEANDTDPDLPDVTSELMALTGETLQDTLTEIDDIADDPTCSNLIDTSVGELTQDVIDVAPIADALTGVDLVEITLTAATSEVDGADDALNASADQVFASISGPSLDFLDELIVAALQGAADGIVTEVETLVGQELPEELDVTDELAAALDQVPLLDDSSPLLVAAVSGGSATASLDLTETTAEGDGALPFVTVTIAPAVVELLGGDPEMATVTLEAGQTQTIAADTPAESTISVGDLAVDDDAEDTDTGLRGSRAETSVTTVALLTGVEGGIRLSLGASSAGAYGGAVTTTSTPPAPDPDPDPELPHTGGGAALGAFLALGAGWSLLRRRRD